MEEKLLKIDEVRKRINVSHKLAKEALDNAGDDILEAVMILEEKYPETIDSIKHTAQKTVETLKDSPLIKISKDKEEILSLPAVFGLGAALLAIKKPKLLFISIGLGIISGLDLSLKYGNKEYSVRESLKVSSDKFHDNIIKTRSELENKIFESKDKGFLKEDKSGERYHTIKL